MEENPPNGKKTDTCRRATAVGLDDWIICKSTKRNQTYYFNTLTGKSVWTLSEANKEKATIQTSQQCPEPAEPAVMPSTSQLNNVQADTANLAEGSKDQVADYKFMQPPPILISGFGVPQLGHFNNFPGNPAAPFKNIIWDRPPPNYPSYPVLTVPPVQTQANDKHDIIVQNTAVPLSQRFKEIKEQSKEPFIIQTLKEKVSGQSYKPIRPKRFLEKDDLRMKLTAKRRMQHTKSIECCVKDPSETRTERIMGQLNINDKEKETAYQYDNFKITKVERPTIEKKVCDEEDQIWLQENMRIENHKSHIDVSPLRDGAPDGVNTDCWFIMADTNVYISNLVFLNFLIHSDIRCYLLVSKIVLFELEREANETANGFLKTLLLSGKAKKCGDIARCGCVNTDALGPGNVGCPLGDDRLLKCCLRVAANNYHVIFLSNDKLLERKATTTAVPFFNVEKIKELLARYRKEKDEKEHSEEILITIDNNEKCDEPQDNLKVETDVYEQEEEKEEQEEEEEFYENETYDDNEAEYYQQTMLHNLSSLINQNNLGHESQVPKHIPTSPELRREESDMPNSNKVSQKMSSAAPSAKESYNSSNMTVKQRTHPDALKNMATREIESHTCNNMGAKQRSLSDTIKMAIVKESNITAKQRILPGTTKNTETFQTDSYTCNNRTSKQRPLHDSKAAAVKDSNTSSNIIATQLNLPGVTKNVTVKQRGLSDTMTSATVKESSTSIDIKAKQRTLFDTIKTALETESYNPNNITAKQRTLPGAMKNTATREKESHTLNNVTANQRTPPDPIQNAATSGAESNTSSNVTGKKRIIRLKRNMELRRSPREHVKKPPVKWRRRPLAKTRPDTNVSETITANDRIKYSPKTYSKNRIQDQDQKSGATLDKNKTSPQVNDDVASSIGEVSCKSIRNISEPNKTVDETSSSDSDVISNSQSSINSDKPNLNLSNYSYSQRTPAKTNVPPPMNNAMVFNLSSGCEDLVAQFVQIMEDMFQQILLHIQYPKPEFFPMNLQEATVCIKIRFSEEESVREAASNFLDLLLEFKDARGSVRRDMNPQDYMKMFGCGEKLARSLKEALPKYEDIETTLEYLDILLKDIKELKSNDTVSLLDDNYESADRTYDSGEKRPSTTETNSQQVKLPLEPHSPNDYQETTFIRSVPEGALEEHQSKKKQSMFSEPPAEAVLQLNDFEEQVSDVPKKPGPKISCEFKICPFIEERLKLRARGTLDLEGDLDDCLDYEEMNEEEDELDPNYSDGEMEDYDDEQYIEDQNVNSLEAESLGSNENVGSFIKIFMRDIKHSLLNVNSFCKDTFTELDNLSVSRRLDIRAKANNAHSILESLHAELKSILERESKDTESSIGPLKNDVFRGRELSTYRDVILQCTEQVKALLVALDTIRFLSNLDPGL